MRPALNRMREYLHRLPTADLYFLNPLRALGRAHLGGARVPRIRFPAPNVYTVGCTGVIVRYGREDDIDLLTRMCVRQIVYIADDDFAAGAEDPHLPARYREKLAEFAKGPWPALCKAADIVIVPGAVLAAAYGSKARIMPPAWHLHPASSDHFERSSVIRIVHLGTGSHLADLAAFAPVIADVLKAHSRTRLTLFSPGRAAAPLADHAQVDVRPPMSWWRYKLSLPRMRFHMALYPLAETAFNRARSANKLYEHALVGAASLMSPNPALREAAEPDLLQIFVEGGPDNWTDRIAAGLADPEALRRRADATRAHITAANPLDRAARMWRDILAADIS